jgi:hypothetical protein
LLPIHQIEAGGQFRLAVRSGRGVTQNRAEPATIGQRAGIRGWQKSASCREGEESDPAKRGKRQFELRGQTGMRRKKDGAKPRAGWYCATWQLYTIEYQPESALRKLFHSLAIIVFR